MSSTIKIPRTLPTWCCVGSSSMILRIISVMAPFTSSSKHDKKVIALECIKNVVAANRTHTLNLNTRTWPNYFEINWKSNLQQHSPNLVNPGDHMEHMQTIKNEMTVILLYCQHINKKLTRIL